MLGIISETWIFSERYRRKDGEMCRDCDKPLDPKDYAFGGWHLRFHELITLTSPIWKFQQGLKVLYQKIKYQCLGTDDPRLVTYHMQVMFIIIFDIINKFYVKVLFWFLASGSQDVQAEAGRMRTDYYKGLRYPKKGVHVNDMDYFYNKGGQGEIVWVFPHYLVRELEYTGPARTDGHAGPGSIF